MTDLINYGFLPEISVGEGQTAARVTAVHRDRYELVCRHGECAGRLKTGVYYADGTEEFPTTGDFVHINYNENGDSQIIKTLARKSFFSRRAPGPIPRDQAVAANFDYVFLLQSLNQDFNPMRLERYLALAWQSGALPVVVLTKADLTDDPSEYIRLAGKTASGVCVHIVSAVTGQGLEEIREYLKPRKTVVLLGSSGVGKSSLVNAVAGEALMAVNDIREDDAKGRHTTTHRQLLMLPCGAMIIDTPGMRELAVGDASAGLESTFTDIEQYLGHCRFSDCKHKTEPGCAIRAAIARGELTQERWESYRKLRREARYAENKNSALLAKWKFNKDHAKEYRKVKAERKTRGDY